MRTFKNDIFSCAGDPIKIIYSPVVNEDGTITLKESGKEDFDEYINSFRDEVDINVLMARYANGEIDVLNKRQGVYGDFTEFPKTYADMLQLQIDSKKYFDSLPVEVKEKFNNDSNQFFAQTGSKEWYEIMSSMYPEEKNVKESEVKEEVKTE